jgi:hypothetical protein
MRCCASTDSSRRASHRAVTGGNGSGRNGAEQGGAQKLSTEEKRGGEKGKTEQHILHGLKAGERERSEQRGIEAWTGRDSMAQGYVASRPLSSTRIRSTTFGWQ